MGWALGLAVLRIVVVTGASVASLVTVVHEGGHVVVAVLSGRGPVGFHVNQNSGGGVTWVDGSWGIGNNLGLLAGYLTPPLVAGASALRAGLTWPVLMVAVLVLIGANFEAENLSTSWIGRAAQPGAARAR